MKNTPINKNSRRKFLTLGLLSGAALISPVTSEQQKDSNDDEKVKMLTPDGQLVEVSRKNLTQSDARQKARNEDILKWSHKSSQSEDHGDKG
jgi:hypothetical protein